MLFICNTSEQDQHICGQCCLYWAPLNSTSASVGNAVYIEHLWTAPTYLWAMLFICCTSEQHQHICGQCCLYVAPLDSTSISVGHSFYIYHLSFCKLLLLRTPSMQYMLQGAWVTWGIPIAADWFPPTYVTIVTCSLTTLQHYDSFWLEIKFYFPLQSLF